jgi:hypothetical protein
MTSRLLGPLLKSGASVRYRLVNDSIKISDGGKAYLPQARNITRATTFWRKGCARGS